MTYEGKAPPTREKWKCAFCVYHDRNNEGRGICRRYPPRVIGEKTVWPVVYAEEYCGSFSYEKDAWR